MKKALKWAFLVFIILCAFFSFTQVRENTLSGVVENLKTGDKVYVVSYHASKKTWMADDSVTVAKDGEFSITTTDKNEVIHLHFVKSSDTLNVGKSYAKVFLEGLGKYALTGNAEEPTSIKIRGGVYDYPLMQSIDSMKYVMNEIRQSITSLRNEEVVDTVTVSALREKLSSLQNSMDTMYKDVINEYPEDIHSAYLLKESYILIPENMTEISAIYGTLGEKAVKSSYARDVKKKLDNLSRAVEGGEAADFALTEITTGDTLRLSDRRGSVVLLEFWASWCPPCRRSNPHLVELYKKYHPAGLEVIGVAVSDREEAWKKAIEDDGLLWSQVNSREEVKGQDNIAETYVVAYIPTSIIVDGEGKIIYRGEPDGVEEKLRTLFPDVK